MRKTIRLLYYIFAASAVAFSFVHAAASPRQPTPEQSILVYEAAQRHGVDPDLALAIMEVESAFNPKAIGALKEVGLFQLRPEYHGEGASFDERTNIETGIRYLSTLYSACSTQYGSAYFVCFNRGPHSRKLRNPYQTAYYKKVITLYNARKETQLRTTVPYGAR